MSEDMTTRWIIVKERAKALMYINTRKTGPDLEEGEVLTDEQRYAYALCEELDRLEEKINNIKTKE